VIEVDFTTKMGLSMMGNLRMASQMGKEWFMMEMKL